MHIPDGFLSPQTWLPAAGLAAVAWAWAGRGLRDRLDPARVPRLAVITALAYGLGLVMLPLPGATSGHLMGVPVLTLLFGVRLAFLATSLVLMLQALLFGAGGVTAWPVNALVLGLVGALTTRTVFSLLRPLNMTLAVALSAWAATVVAALLLALVLGLQPLIAHGADGSPLFFPFPWSVVVPALVLPHLLLGIGEAVVTVLVWGFAKRRGWLGAPLTAPATAGGETPATLAATVPDPAISPSARP